MMPAIDIKPDTDHINELFKGQRQALSSLRTEPIGNRKKRLKALAGWIKSNRTYIQQALYNDFKKPEAEADAIDIFPLLQEIKHVLDNLDRWVKPKKVDAPLTFLGTRSFITYEPRGVCLVIAPWNYPFLLAIGPVVSALAAGNSVVVKPSEFTPHTSALIKKMCNELFDERIVAVCEGGYEVAQQLLQLPFDHIFFTGSPGIGKLVMKAAAENLASVTLELGGKSPAIIAPSAKLNDAITRVAVAKFFNNGQTCVAPDYIMVHRSVFPAFISGLKKEVIKLFSKRGEPIKDSPYYARIVNDRHFNRLHEMIEDAVERGAKVEFSGPADASTRFIHPMIMTNVSDDSRLMQEEIFGPVLPVLEYDSLEEAMERINQKPKPLSLYLFSNSRQEKSKVLKGTSSGGVCINDCAIHFLHHNLPFGGVNNSGMGKSHGYFGFLAFSNEKPVLQQRNGLSTFHFFYPPYTATVKRLMDWLIRMF